MDDFAHIVGEDVHFRGRSPSGERGLKYFRKRAGIAHFPGRSPSGERGLKYVMWCEAISALPVAPHPGSVD